MPLYVHATIQGQGGQPRLRCYGCVMINHEVSDSSIKEVINELFVCIVDACDCLNNERDLNEVLDREVSFIILDI